MQVRGAHSQIAPMTAFPIGISSVDIARTVSTRARSHLPVAVVRGATIIELHSNLQHTPRRGRGGGPYVTEYAPASSTTAPQPIRNGCQFQPPRRDPSEKLQKATRRAQRLRLPLHAHARLSLSLHPDVRPVAAWVSMLSAATSVPYIVARPGRRNAAVLKNPRSRRPSQDCLLYTSPSPRD